MADTIRRAEREATIPNSQGMHMRPAARFVELASTFSSSISVHNRSTSVDGKSPFEMMQLEAGQGSVLKIVAEGDDCIQAIEALVKLVGEGFGEK